MSDEKKIVLIVEDDAFIRDIYSVKFSQEGYQTEIATNGIEALSKLEKIFPDIIILDVVMPTWTAWRLLEISRRMIV